MEPEISADIFVTRHAFGHLLRAEMQVGSEGSGKLVTELRKKASKLSGGLVIIDGSPGVGCPVIASITASDIVLIVTEPTQSGKQDLIRVAELCAHFGVRTLACVNKFDINEEMTQIIEDKCSEYGIGLVGRIPYDERVMRAINELRPITDDKQSAAGEAICRLWTKLQPLMTAEKKESR
jgi:MinD superfamily P-loop ATPase